MIKKRPQLMRDILLVGLISLIVLFILIFSLVSRQKGEVAYVKYDSNTLFAVKLENGEFTPNTTLYESEFMPVIAGADLLIDNQVFTALELGNGVLVYENCYVIKGNLGYVLIEYNASKKMIRVKQETSPYNICSNQGYSSVAPIICLPNFVSIVFSDASYLDVIIG